MIMFFMWIAYVAVLVLLADTAWRSWTSSERVADTPHPGVAEAPAPPWLGGLRVFYSDPAPAPDMVAAEVIPGRPFWSAPESVGRHAWVRRADMPTAEQPQVLQVQGHEGATEDWSPAAEVAGVGPGALERVELVDQDVRAEFDAAMDRILADFRVAMEPAMRKARRWRLDGEGSYARQALNDWRIGTETGEYPLVRV